MPEIAVALEALVELLARRVTESLAESMLEQRPHEHDSPWMGIERASAYLDWPRQRLYKLTAQSAIPHYKHEGRLLFHREELDDWLSQFAQGGPR